MKIYNVLNSIFSAPSAVSILRELSIRNTGLTGRELARITNLTPQTAHNTLANLEALNIVDRITAGRSYYFTLNRKHYLNKRIVAKLFEDEREYVSSIFEAIKKKLGKNSVSLIVFGSVARKEETAESDLDLCIVYKGRKALVEENVSELRNKLYTEYGITLAPFYITEAEFKSRVKNNKPPVNNITKEGNVISGKPINRIING
ncbi:MAG: nucleotidyltransferase domain-containing protein [Melioribacteraceae bacterium]|nr:nucleotidyltransferase domain-containing protein [Melioribacteraceae bacterium]MCF8353980.1 nucleotidyltransferase domain-containing protein [Melioribacteraceae bacterium]MCF8393708.1 nucleotidyltransferase domain-containing protein [Melioribacteraceae bacterium]MCF8419550.1 nucleotidyltransferase domain-containing protein [Melioribacteraceae bacterium]